MERSLFYNIGECVSNFLVEMFKLHMLTSLESLTTGHSLSAMGQVVELKLQLEQAVVELYTDAENWERIELASVRS